MRSEHHNRIVLTHFARHAFDSEVGAGKWMQRFLINTQIVPVQNKVHEPAAKEGFELISLMRPADAAVHKRFQVMRKPSDHKGIGKLRFNNSTLSCFGSAKRSWRMARLTAIESCLI